MDTKEINYAFPHSVVAKAQGFAKNGCYFVSTGPEEGDYDDRTITSAHLTYADAEVAFDTIDLPVGSYTIDRPNDA